ALAGILLAVVIAGGLLWKTPPNRQSEPTYVGTQQCASCHLKEHQGWTGSHHDLAMQAATLASVLAPFKGERFTQDGITSTFTQRDGRFYVRTDGPDGQLQDFEVSHTLGVTPLQQYLIPMPRGAIQALTIAWDTRPKAKGGQRWFHLQAGQNVRAGDELHWTGRQNNWNYMCAECHTTQFKKNYTADTQTYASSWSAVNVACEACHGPGSKHLEWTQQTNSARGEDKSLGLTQPLDERHGVQWAIQPATGNAVRSQPPVGMRHEVEMCARCHSHRSQISDNYVHGKPLLDTHLPSLVDTQLFWPDGQMRAEVYNYASYQQSKMFQKGVTCSDCHNPHTLKLRAPGNQTCLQCHAADKYQAPTHHFHKTDSAGASCADCHMPTTTYMSVDPRHDHSIRVPRPDLSVRDGTPNACRTCHTDKSPAWAAQWAQKWYPNLTARPAPLANKGSSVAHASALAQAVTRGAPDALQQVTSSLSDSDPLVRKTAVDTLSGAPPEVRTRWLKPLLADPVRAVRIAAARGLAGVPTTDWSAQDLAALKTATQEFIAVQQFNADRPEALSDLGMLYADQGDWAKAETLLKQAMAMETHTPAAALNLADIYRAQGREDDAQALIRQIIRQHPNSAAAQHALGLSLIRKHRYAESLGPLQRAAQLEPGNRQYAYVASLAKAKR
ncbi:MAG: ammonia-forming cytochrome c nitrite reductase subunit c552, partial [Rhodoferax sp.]|nr:ammonia-forming cytochrome c nitrite reductase subunit c552 [Rhodoferax sp.]